MGKKIMLFSVILSLALGCLAYTPQVMAKEEQIGLGPNYAKEGVKASNLTPIYSPYGGRKYATDVYWGDTHLHTSNSFDAGAFGNRLGPDEAYQFARGDDVVSTTNQPVRLSRPLDFLVVSDHAANMGFFDKLLAGDPMIMADETGRKWHKAINAGGQEAVGATIEMIDAFSRGEFPEALIIEKPSDVRPVWESIIESAERYNDPGKFTAFIGYEWTSLVAPGNNLHRVVIYRDDENKAIQTIPFTSFDSQDPEDLWKALEAYENKTGGRLLAIPHNGNLSNGMMFALARLNGDPITREYASERIRWEPLVEVTQIKGDGESHPYLSPDDEFADYETWDKGNLNLSEAKTPDMLAGEYARSALKRGLAIEKKVGVNPYKFGMIGSTDSHTSLSTASEDNYFGKHTGTEPSPDRMSHPFADFGDLKIIGWEEVASGYAAVWATENTREALFDAMQRKEVYATTGPRMIVRFFGGWDFVDDDARTRKPADVGYSKGVPMGGDLLKTSAGKAPSFLVAALKDPIGANLDRIQIIKGWVDTRGKLHEKIYDVAVSDGRKIGKDGRCKTSVGNTVDLESATWVNTIGASELITVWEDPDFDPKVKAFYYARVIAIPTPRWTAYDAKRFGVEAPEGARMITRDRAYTSPIWYAPEKD